MKNQNSIKKNIFIIVFISGLVFLNIFVPVISDIIANYNQKRIDKHFHILSSVSNKDFEEELTSFADKNNIDIYITYQGDLEIVETLNTSPDGYDAVWISNSIWLYMLENKYLVSESKSIGINPVIFGIKRSQAHLLGFTDKEIYNKDILNAIKNGSLKYTMPSVTKTNSGMSSYLSLLNNFAGSPEVLTTEMLNDQLLVNNLTDFFKGVERVSGDEDFAIELFKNGEYDAIISYESSLIKLNKELVKDNKSPLYLVYPVDGVAMNDMPFGFIDRFKDPKRKEQFKKLQDFLLSDETKLKLEGLGFRTWYGGIKESADKSSFNPTWGINTNNYLIPINYPSKKVIDEAINLYINELRKPTHTVFCLDLSGSMMSSGLDELKEAMNYILDPITASADRVQFSKRDKVTIITFNEGVKDTSYTLTGEKITDFIPWVNNLYAGGGTNIYAPSIRAINKLEKENKDEYNTAVILMTDGESNMGTYESLENHYSNIKSNVPIYSITFGDSNESQLWDVARLTNGRVFDGKSGLKKAFTEVRGYN